MKLIYPALFLILFSIISCQSDSKEAQIENKKTTFANFYLRYLQQERKVKGEAYFRMGQDAQKGTAVEYDKGVFFDGGNMEMKKAVGRKLYRSDRKADFKSQYKFEVNPKGKDQYDYTMNINPISSFQINGKVSKSKGFELTWEGSNLSKKEELVLLFTDTKNKAFNIDISGPTATPKISISKEKLAKINTGKGALYLVRKLKEKTIKPGIETIAVSEFYTKSIEVEVVD